MSITYIINLGSSQVLAIEKKGIFSTEKIVGQLKFRIRSGSNGKVLASDDIGVDKNYQNKGIGTSLTKKAIEYAKSQKCDYVMALAQPDYLNLLQKIGFSRDGFFAILALK